ncbi:MAG: Exodeoxyribonuclease 7 large subunit [Candidatus Celerinatantimonas neptuna]|nr:MAG: Exodeoxyribonuclease 7 large subunit [Candidatus Celerinatantimonas neptuna]
MVTHHQDKILSVSQLNQRVRQHLETHIGEIWLKGEISNLAQPSSGHWYFSLKDNKAQVRCAMFKTQNRKVLFSVQDGQQVLVRARISVYEPRGEYQLIIQSIQPDGLGELQLAYEQLRGKLASEGLFSETRKRPIPEIVERVGVITSATGAAFHDITAVLKRLAPGIEIILYPSPVQGSEAPSSLCNALNLANRRNEVDVIILGRGGGSMEDLWAFNYEPLTRLVSASRLPIISAVGHEIDFTLTDFAADWRAPTPSAAAERVGHGMHLKTLYFQQLHQQLNKLAIHYFATHRQTFEHLTLRLKNQSPVRQLLFRQQHMDELQLRLNRVINGKLEQCQHQQNTFQERLSRAIPDHFFDERKQHIQQLSIRLQQSYKHQIAQLRSQFLNQVSQLEALSPLSTLQRGYSTIQNAKGQWITHTKQVKKDMSLILQLQDGYVTTKVTNVESCRHKQNLTETDTH